MNFYLIHCGYYEKEISNGIYELHINIPIVAENLEAAKMKVRQLDVFVKKKMHIDGIQEIKTVSGYRIELILDSSQNQHNVIVNHLHRDL